MERKTLEGKFHKGAFSGYLDVSINLDPLKCYVRWSTHRTERIWLCHNGIKIGLSDVKGILGSEKPSEHDSKPCSRPCSKPWIFRKCKKRRHEIVTYIKARTLLELLTNYPATEATAPSSTLPIPLRVQSLPSMENSTLATMSSVSSARNMLESISDRYWPRLFPRERKIYQCDGWVFVLNARTTRYSFNLICNATVTRSNPISKLQFSNGLSELPALERRSPKTLTITSWVPTQGQKSIIWFDFGYFGFKFGCFIYIIYLFNDSTEF